MGSNEKAEKRLKNLIPFKPGQSGNPKGHLKGVPNCKTRFKKLLEKYTAMKIPEKVRNSTPSLTAIDFTLDNPKDLTFEEAIGAKVVLDAIDGKPHALDRVYDKPSQPMDVKSEITYPQGIEVKFIKAEGKK